jgi:hypothetical protein
MALAAVETHRLYPAPSLANFTFMLSEEMPEVLAKLDYEKVWKERTDDVV